MYSGYTQPAIPPPYPLSGSPSYRPPGIQSPQTLVMYQLDIEECLTSVKSLTKSELQGLLDDDAKIDELIHNSKPVQNILNEKGMLLASNSSLSEFNLSREPRLAQAKANLMESHKQYMEIRQEFDNEKAKLDSLSSSRSLETVLAILKAGAAEVEEETDQMSEDFLEGRMDIGEFLSTYVNKRTLAHLRRVKVEKMQELLHDT